MSNQQVSKVCEACGEPFLLMKGPGYNNRITCYKCTDRDKKVSYRNKHLKRKYGITQYDYKRMYDSQEGKCATCGLELSFVCGTPGKGIRRKPNDTCIDHDHTTGEVRELLCFSCNTALGHARDDPGILFNMIDYLRKHSLRYKELS